MKPIVFQHQDIELPRSRAAVFDEPDAWKKSAVTLSVGGHGVYEIAQTLGKDVREVSALLTSEWAKKEIAVGLSERSVGVLESAQLKAAALDATITLQELMHKSASDQVRLNAAKEILNRTLGVPTTKVLHMQNSTSSLDVRAQIEELEKQLKLNSNG